MSRSKRHMATTLHPLQPLLFHVPLFTSNTLIFLLPSMIFSFTFHLYFYLLLPMVWFSSLGRIKPRIFSSLFRSQKVAGSIHNDVINFFNLPNPCSRNMALVWPQALTEMMSTRKLSEGNGSCTIAIPLSLPSKGSTSHNTKYNDNQLCVLSLCPQNSCL
jgi:hypothetical protein